MIYYIRHGENWANLTRELSHRLVDYSLTPRGLLQAEQTARFMRGKPVDAVISSPLKRALETAAPIAAVLGLPVEVMEEFRELNVGSLERELPSRAVWDQHDLRLNTWLDGREREMPFPDGENYFDLLARIQRGMRAAARRGNAVVVGHGGVLYATLPDLVEGMHPRWTRENDYNPNCAVTQFDVYETDGRLQLGLLSWARHDHLSGEAAVRVSGTPKRAGRPRPSVIYLCGPRAGSARRLAELAHERPGWRVYDSWAEDGLSEEEMVRRVGSAQKWGMVSLFARVEQALRECRDDQDGEGAIIAGPGQAEDLRRAAEIFNLSEWQAVSNNDIW